MKRRNVDCPKPRRSLKRPKIDGFYGSSFMYLKFLLVWLLVIGADFLFEFRFEYLWPFWLLLRSVYDSFRYQGFAFSILFVCMALTSDMICLLFIPVNWLFFAASTYVWVQFIWHTEKGFCMPTVLLWALFIYMEAIVRLKDLRNTPFHLDLCRPFAAHCIGYPVVTLGFGLKSYVGFRLKQRKQRDVAKQNNVYYQLLEEALPSYLRTSRSSEDKTETSNGSIQQDVNVCSSVSNSNNSVTSGAHKSRAQKSESKSDYQRKSEISPPPKIKVATGPLSVELEYMQQKMWSSSKSVNDYDETEVEKDKNHKNSSPQTGGSASIPNSLDSDKKKSNNSSQMNGSAKFPGSHTNNLRDSCSANSSKDRKNKNKDSNKEISQAPKDDTSVSIIRLESDVKRLKADLQSSRQTEQELRNQINTLVSSEKATRSEMHQLQQDNDNLQNKLHNLVTARQGDRSTISSLERKLQDEKKLRQTAESQVTQLERKIKKLEDINQNKERALANAKLECSEACRGRRGELEGELRRARRDQRASEDRARGLDRENTALRACKDQQSETEVLMSALSAMQDKTTHLETSLSAETKIKLDLFSALGEAKRQMELSQNIIASKDKEIEDLKKKIAEIMAVCPQPSFQSNSVDPSRMCYSSKMKTSSRSLMMPDSFLDGSFDSVVGRPFQLVSQHAPLSPPGNHSNLDPNARVYTPKSSGHPDCDIFNNL